MIPRLKEQYNKVIIESLKNKFSLKNKLEVPRFEKKKEKKIEVKK